MSDDEDIPVKKKVKFGSKTEAENVQKVKNLGKKPNAANVNVSKEHFELDKVVDPQKEAVLAEFDRRRKARTLSLPTDDASVKDLLRNMGHPICLFGEEKPDRRERLRTLLSAKEDDEIEKILRREELEEEVEEVDESTWYHEGPQSLRHTRVFFVKYSLPRAKERLEGAREKSRLSSQAKAVKQQETHRWIRSLALYGSQVGDNRPISYGEFSPTSELVATASWSGLCKVWSIPNCELVQTLRGHNTNAGCIRFHPESGKTADPAALNMASSSHDGAVLLWSLDSSDPVASLDGHEPNRVSRICFHPSGRFLATCCHDNSWRLFDLEVNEEVLFQEGHSKPVFDVDFHPDGSLALTGGMDAYGRLWDIRTGRCIMFLEGHQNHLLSVNFAPNGYIVGSGSADNTVKMWDIRMRRAIYTLPAHKNLVSKIKVAESFLISGSYDHSIKIWTNPGWQEVNRLEGHDSKVMCVDVSGDGKWVLSTSMDRTFKLWTPLQI